VGFTRRRLLVLAGAIPALLVAERVHAVVSEVSARAIAGARPAGGGTSATRCARCGADDHAMLDTTCPAAPRLGRR
jgi:hypothetical protein